MTSVKRTGTTKNFTTKLSKMNGQFQEVESFLLEEVYKQKLDCFLLAALCGLMHHIWGCICWPLISPPTLRPWFCIFPSHISEYPGWEWFLLYLTSDSLFKPHGYLWCWHNKQILAINWKKEEKVFGKEMPSSQIPGVITPVMSSEVPEDITGFLGSY